MHPKDAEGIANSVDPDHTAPLGAVWSGSALFAQICLSENLRTLQYKDAGRMANRIGHHQTAKKQSWSGYSLHCFARSISQASTLMAASLWHPGGSRYNRLTGELSSLNAQV